MDDFERDIWCLLGLPFDAVTMAQAAARVREAARRRARCFCSTANLNFLIAAQTDPAFRESVIDSDLSLADGMPIVWLARLLGMPIRERVAGSDLFEALRRAPPRGDRIAPGAALPPQAACPPGAAHPPGSAHPPAAADTAGAAHPRPLSAFFFGGPEGAAELACARLNADAGAVRCVGWHSPGFVGVEAMSGEDVIAKINASGADFLVVSLGARKGQAWIVRNLPRLEVPVVSHLGAVVNFLAGSVSRAPQWVQRAGLEWLWRIKEEPALWWRYARDGLQLLGLLATRVLPYTVWRWSRRIGSGAVPEATASARLVAATSGDASGRNGEAADGSCRVALAGALVANNLEPIRQAFRTAAARGVDVTVDLAQVTEVDGAFLGLLMLLRKQVHAAGGRRLRIEGASGAVRRAFWFNAAGYLLE